MSGKMSPSINQLKVRKWISRMRVAEGYSNDGRMLSKYWSRTKPSGSTQAMFDSALDPTLGNQATKWVEVTVPANEKIFRLDRSTTL